MNNYVEKISNKIEQISDNIYDYNIKVMFNNIDSLILEISNCINLEGISEGKINVFNTILENINISIRNKDYQLISDILNFQLKDFMKNV